MFNSSRKDLNDKKDLMEKSANKKYYIICFHTILMKIKIIIKF